jgi:hypothetical protein
LEWKREWLDGFKSNFKMTIKESNEWAALTPEERKAKNPALYFRMKVVKWAALLFRTRPVNPS